MGTAKNFGSGHAGTGLAPLELLQCVCEDPAVAKQNLITGPHVLMYKCPSQEWAHKMHFRVAGER